MGACASSSAAEGYDFDESYRAKYFKLQAEHKELVAYFENKLEPQDNNEQLNLLRYKIELLLTMLAMEEKSKEVVSNRLETMKWMLVSQGTSESQMEELMSQYGKDRVPMTFNLEEDIDMASVIEKMKNYFKSFKSEIVTYLVDGDGNMILNLTREDFVIKMSALVDLTKKELMVLSIRFFDGNYVSIPEFVAFFTTPQPVQQARSASYAVQANEELLDIAHVGGGGGTDLNATLSSVSILYIRISIVCVILTCHIRYIGSGLVADDRANATQ